MVLTTEEFEGGGRRTAASGAVVIIGAGLASRVDVALDDPAEAGRLEWSRRTVIRAGAAAWPVSSIVDVVLSTSGLVADFRALGVRCGDVPMVHASLRAIGPVQSSASIPFAVELLRWVRPQDDVVKTLTVEQTAEAGRLLVERIVPVWEGDDPFTTFGKGTAGTLHVWAVYGDREALRGCLARRIAADPSDAFRLMGAFLGQAWSMETGAPLVPEFHREGYNALADYVDPAQVFACLQERFSDDVGAGDFYGFREMSPEQRLANEFAFIHRVALKEQKAAAADASAGRAE